MARRRRDTPVATALLGEARRFLTTAVVSASNVPRFGTTTPSATDGRHSLAKGRQVAVCWPISWWLFMSRRSFFGQQVLFWPTEFCLDHESPFQSKGFLIILFPCLSIVCLPADLLLLDWDLAIVSSAVCSICVPLYTLQAPPLKPCDWLVRSPMKPIGSRTITFKRDWMNPFGRFDWVKPKTNGLLVNWWLFQFSIGWYICGRDVTHFCTHVCSQKICVPRLMMSSVFAKKLFLMFETKIDILTVEARCDLLAP